MIRSRFIGNLSLIVLRPATLIKKRLWHIQEKTANKMTLVTTQYGYKAFVNDDGYSHC